jgi:hypothetical protein
VAEENRGKITKEEKIKEKTDDKGDKWTKVYFGGGAHFRNWLSQTEEIYGKENVEVEEIDAAGLKCFEEGGEKLYRIWVREDAKSGELVSE